MCLVCEEFQSWIQKLKAGPLSDEDRDELRRFLQEKYDAHVMEAGEAAWYGE